MLKTGTAIPFAGRYTRRALALFIIFCAASLVAQEKGAAPKPDAIPTVQSAAEFTALVEKNADRLLAFDLYADWCAPCRMLTPTLTQLAQEKKGKVSFYKINVDKLPEVSQLFGVSSIPVVAFVKNRQTVFAIMGLQPKEAYAKAIDTYSAPKSGPNPEKGK
jgi:thioredoxin 1